MPCVKTLVFLSTRMDMAELLVNGLDDLFSRVADRIGRRNCKARGRENFSPLLDVRSLEPDDERHRYGALAPRVDDSPRDHVAAHDPAENIDQHALYALIRE